MGAVFIILVISWVIIYVQSWLSDNYLPNTFLILLTGQRAMNGFLFFYAESVIKKTQIMVGVPSYQLGNSALL